MPFGVNYFRCAQKFDYCGGIHISDTNASIVAARVDCTPDIFWHVSGRQAATSSARRAERTGFGRPIYSCMHVRKDEDTAAQS